VKEFAVYTAARLGLFVVTYAVIIGVYLLVSGEDQVPLFWPFLLAVVVSSVASVVLLRRQRDRFAQVVERRAQRNVARAAAVREEEQRMAHQETAERETAEQDDAERRHPE